MNLLILAVVVLAAGYLSSAWKEFRQTHNLERIVNKGPGGIGEAPHLSPKVEEPQPLTEFVVISEKNLFVPDRRPESAPPPALPPQPPPPVKPTLHGTSMVAGKKQAFLTVFEGSQGKSRTVSEGDNVQGYTVARINHNTVDLKWNDQIMTIEFAGRPPQPAAAARAVAPTTILSIGTAAAAVETSQSAAVAQEQPALQVSVVGAQTAQRGPVPGIQVVERAAVRSSVGDRGPGVGSGTNTQPNVLPATMGIGAHFPRRPR